MKTNEIWCDFESQGKNLPGWVRDGGTQPPVLSILSCATLHMATVHMAAMNIAREVDVHKRKHMNVFPYLLLDIKHLTEGLEKLF